MIVGLFDALPGVREELGTKAGSPVPLDALLRKDDLNVLRLSMAKNWSVLRL